MWRIYGGAVALLAGIVAFIVDDRHSRLNVIIEGGGGGGLLGERKHLHGVISGTAYDLIRVGGWALIIGGVVLVCTGLIWYSATLRR